MIKGNLKLDKDVNLFADELKRCFSKEELDEIARETGFVVRQVSSVVSGRVEVLVG